MKKVSYKEWQRYKCGKLGHDWAYQDCDTFMKKICLRCNAVEYFFPEETEQEVEKNENLEHREQQGDS